MQITRTVLDPDNEHLDMLRTSTEKKSFFFFGNKHVTDITIVREDAKYNYVVEWERKPTDEDLNSFWKTCEKDMKALDTEPEEQVFGFIDFTKINQSEK